MPPTDDNTRPALRPGWFSALLALLAVMAATGWATVAFLHKAPERLAVLQSRQLAEQSSEAARETLTRSPELGNACIELLVAGMADERPEVAYRAADVLHIELRRWRSALTRQGEQSMQRLAQALAAELENFSPASREEAGQLADAILAATPPRGEERPLQTLVACEEVLRATLATRDDTALPATAALPGEPQELER